jgi:hypothetical protein
LTVNQTEFQPGLSGIDSVAARVLSGVAASNTTRMIRTKGQKVVWDIDGDDDWFRPLPVHLPARVTQFLTIFCGIAEDTVPG